MSTGSPFETQQVGNLWQGDYLLSLGLSGDISYLDAAGGGITRTIKVGSLKIVMITKQKVYNTPADYCYNCLLSQKKKKLN